MKNFYIMTRGWMDDDIFAKQPFTEREAFLYLIEHAAWKNRKYRIGTNIIILQRGQLTASVRYLAEAWQWNKNKVSRYLKTIQKANMIRVESGTAQNIITVCNYSRYQDVDKNNGTDVGQMWDRCGTDVGQMWDKTNKDNLENKENKDKQEEVFLDKIKGLWNEKNKRLVPVKNLSLDRERRIKTIGQPFEWWEAYFLRVSQSPFLIGDVTSFAASFDWCLKDVNIAKILDGNYDPKDEDLKHEDVFASVFGDKENAN